MNVETKTKAKRKTPIQKRAYDYYKLRERMEDNFLGSVFAANESERERYRNATEQAYKECLRLGLTNENGWYL